ncbi:uncharacterized protein LOC141525514, partial [Cotesia typhae]|uniref:uncharacterized protein LOC141525514 n=1 Tax=Cotesia typhae TaxID=2053667 RepID=UPI003D68122A
KMSGPNTTSPSVLRDQFIDESIESVNRFVDSVKSNIEQCKEGLKNIYSNYLLKVESEKKLTVPFESFQKADGLYNKLLDSLDKFMKALTTDYLTIKSTIIYELKIVSSQYTKFLKQRSEKPELSKLIQLMAKIKNATKQFNEIVRDYREKMNNFYLLQQNLEDQVIIYTSLSGKTYKILLKDEIDEFINLLGLDESRDLYNQLNIRLVEEFTAKMNEIDDNKLKEIFTLNINELTVNDESMDTEL